MRVLFITPSLSPSGNSGGMQVSLDRLKALCVAHDVEVLSLTQEAAMDGVPCHSPKKTIRPRSIGSLAASYAKNVPLSIYRNMDGDLLRMADMLNAQHSWDLVYCDHWLMWPVAQRIAARHTVLHLHNAEHLLFSRAATRLPVPWSTVAAVEAHRCKQYLKKICAQADEVHYLSATDKALSEEEGIQGAHTRIFPPRCSAPQELLPNVSKPTSAMTLGTLSWDPTRVGMLWFFDKVWPLVEGVRFSIGGTGPSSELSNAIKAAKNVTYLGFVQDPLALYSTSRMFLAPLQDGSGIKIKIINALAQGIPVVTTSCGIEGFEGHYSDFVKVADDPAEFAAHIKHIATLTDAAWLALSLRSRAYAQKYFSGAQFQSWCANFIPVRHASLDSNRLSNPPMDRL